MNIAALISHRAEVMTKCHTCGGDIPAALLTELIEAEEAVLVAPASDKTELRAKLAFVNTIIGEGNWEAPANFFELLMEDVDRLMPV